jgi:hypothetical protein
LDQADASDDVAQLAPVQNAAAGIGAVGLDGIGDIFQRQTKPYELLRIEPAEIASDPPKFPHRPALNLFQPR